MSTQSTPETDAFATKIKTPCGEKYWVPVDLSRRLERELAEARGQRDRLAELHKKNADHFNELLELCGTLRKERNRLAAALRSVIDEDGTPMSIDRANEILQSLIENEPISK